MKRILLAFAFLLLAVPVAEAHTLDRDGTIGAILHIDPDDSPVAGESSNFYFDMKDTSGKFSGAACLCTLNVLRDGERIGSETARATGTSETAAFTFPSTGVYQVELAGVPQPTEAFDPFTVSYAVRVERGTGAGGSGGSDRMRAFLLMSGAAVCAMLVAALAYLYSRKRRTHA